MNRWVGTAIWVVAPWLIMTLIASATTLQFWGPLEWVPEARAVAMGLSIFTGIAAFTYPGWER